MKVLEEIKVSVYENVYSKKPKVMSFLEVISMCIQPVYASSINTIRRYYQEGDHEAAQKQKSKLHCFTPAGTFDGAHAIKNFLHHSCIVGLDYDHVPNRLKVIHRCAEDTHTVAALESPTDGVKIFAFVEGIEGHHREGQQLVSNYYDHLLGLQSDPACKDESRLCYFTYSPNGYIAGLYTPFYLEATREKQEVPLIPTMPTDVQADANAEKRISEKFQVTSKEEINKFLSSYIFLNPLTTGIRHTNLFKLACEACRRGYPQKEVLRGIKEYLKDSDFPESELKSVLHSGYETVNHQSTQTKNTTSGSFKNDKTTKTPYGTLENNDQTDEAYWIGEEYRKQTPSFPQSMYKNLPTLLNDCLLDDEDDREKDIAFLSVLTALSAALPHTFGIYNHKKYSPHFYSFIIAPAGSGKSIAQVGRYLLDNIHQCILSNSQHLQKIYNQEHMLWQTECSRKRKVHEKCAEEPEKPAFKMLLIPATTSYSRMQIQMQDNGDQGSIIFDTEAQTLSTANHLDCGNFDDMLRKAFEHENIDSSFKVNGMNPIFIRYPKLAMFLTGTPGQVDGLLGSSENGLVSRILIYTFRKAPLWKEMGDNSISLEDTFKPLTNRVFTLFQFCLDHPVLFHMSHRQWNCLNKTFSDLLSTVAMEGNDDLQAVVKRYAFLVMRISMIQARIRQFEIHDLSPEIYCEDTDFERSLQIVLCCYEHSRLLLSSMASPTTRPLKDPNSIKNFINELSDRFTTEDAMQLGVKYDFSNRKVNRILKSLNGLNINKVSHGVYTKTHNK